MKRKEIDAILSDYDGTLCSTTSVKGGIGIVDRIPQELEQILFGVSKHIPICILLIHFYNSKGYMTQNAIYAISCKNMLGLSNILDKKRSCCIHHLL